MRIESVSTTPVLSIKDTKDDAKLKESCKQFESVFMGFMLKAMRKTVEKNDLFGSDKSEEVFQDMQDTQMCDSATKSQSIGLADMLYKQLKLQTDLENKR